MDIACLMSLAYLRKRHPEYFALDQCERSAFVKERAAVKL